MLVHVFDNHPLVLEVVLLVELIYPVFTRMTGGVTVGDSCFCWSLGVSLLNKVLLTPLVC